ncbi:alpha/beta hydrolase [Gordonia polyisoprenivorans]|uniref:Esterase family protein n=1 Tax=Gordonia polyisoprenivorans TaxID=84595 RepID=A0A846WLV0_9ACTN|nr:alpha/beta hydrolase family protein [Gordonia polyisoprenivorans]MBE7193200.1 esterase family protein [Gordonia polyisoprenivorans]NKY02654.1 esterase family protein [Gordonia polyisoprenivorans]OZC30186.1 esterase family protein [Gordonia polyisoprenivorans]
MPSPLPRTRALDRPRVKSTVVVLFLVLAAVIVSTVGTARADPGGASIVYRRDIAPREIAVGVYSPAMRRTIDVRMIPARSAHAPTLYLLNGAAGGDGGSSWFDQTDIRSFFADDDVNVVVPMGGAASYFTDWRRDDPVLGRQKWATFLTSELPTVIDRDLGGDGRNAIAGISMAGTSVFQLALRAPNLYRALGSFSGCAQTSDPAGQAAVRMVVEGRGHGDTVNMWGPPTDPEWRANDPYVHADRFRGKSIYISNGSGTPGRYDTLNGPGIDGDATKLSEQLAVGAVIETATDACTHNLQRRMTQLGVAATFHFYQGGTHAWPYWQDELHRAWPQFAQALAR